ncbi:MAG: hypothetical protein H7296_14270 [Bacteroidia bacterium]|nr:hypothetical protein [Bacteroidia bacterium]
MNCNKSNHRLTCDITNTFTIPQKAKDYFVFNTGSFWIYKKIGSDERDTITLKSIAISSTNYFPHFGGDLKKCYQNYRLNYMSSKMGDMFIIVNVLVPNENAGLQDQIYFVAQHNPFNINYTSKTLMFKGDSIYKSDEVESDINFLDSIQILANNYFNVLNQVLVSDEFEFYTEAFYASKTGLIKFKMATDKSIWELESYNLKN